MNNAECGGVSPTRERAWIKKKKNSCQRRQKLPVGPRMTEWLGCLWTPPEVHSHQGERSEVSCPPEAEARGMGGNRVQHAVALASPVAINRVLDVAFRERSLALISKCCASFMYICVGVKWSEWQRLKEKNYLKVYLWSVLLNKASSNIQNKIFINTSRSIHKIHIHIEIITGGWQLHCS